MFFQHQTRAVVLNAAERGEADKEVLFFSESFGRLKVLGKSIRKIDSKLKGQIPLFSLSRIDFIQARHYKILTYAETEENFERIKNNLSKLKVAYKIRDLFQRFVTEPEKDDNLWNLLLNGLQTLSTAKLTENELRLFYICFFQRFFALLGYSLELYKCSSCGKKLLPQKEFVFSRKGALCEKCFKKERNARLAKISINSLKILREIEKEPFARVRQIRIEQSNLAEIENIMIYDFFL